MDNMKLFYRFVLLFMMFCGGSVIFIVLDEALTDYDKYCEDIGMKNYLYTNRQSFCVDYDNNANFVVFDCKGWLWNKECKAEIITIGDLRTIPKK